MKRRIKITGKICFCPKSLEWIRKHLMKSARNKFLQMVHLTTISESGKSRIRITRKKRRTAKQRAATRRLIAFNKRRRR